MSLPSPVHIETERLVLTMPGRRDAPLMVDYFTRNRAHLSPWEPRYPDGFFTNAYWESRLEDARKELIDDLGLRLVIFRRGDESRRAIGIVNFTAIIRLAFNCTNLGYSIDGEHEGQGLMREGLEASIGHVFSELNLHRIQANYQPDNERSGRLLERLGFVIEGYAKDYLLIDGAYRDHILTSLTNPDWSPPTP
jgi:ribosomal-protein-alanine N-acetyltransferase